MKYYLLLLLCFHFSISAKVYDCFPFFNEMDLLTIRLEELDELVDYFVLVESIETQRGNPKPLYFQDNKHLFEKYLHKIIHVEVNERHPEMDLWEREHYQRECILRGLKTCDPCDMILISDVDEIPRPSVLKEIKIKWDSNIQNHKLRNSRKPVRQRTVALQMSIYYFHLNRQTKERNCWGGGLWRGTVIAPYSQVAKFGPQHFRDLRNVLYSIQNGGWHFTWMGGRERVRQKLASVVEGRENGYSVSNEAVDKWMQEHPIVPIDDSFPLYVQKNQEYLRSIDLIAY